MKIVKCDNCKENILYQIGHHIKVNNNNLLEYDFCSLICLKQFFLKLEQKKENIIPF